MDLLQLKYFQVVARLEHMTRAAEELHISQPSLSKMISRLEKHLGVPLFDRHGKQIRLNRFGKIFLNRVDRVFAELEEGQYELADLTGLERGEADLIITHPLIRDPKFKNVPLLHEKMFLAVPPNHRLANQKKVWLRDAAEETYISLVMSYELTQTTLDMCQDSGFVPNIAFECNDAEVILRMVHNGLGVALIPQHWWKHGYMPKDSPVYLPLEDRHSQRIIGLSWVESRYITLAARELIRFTIDYFEHTYPSLTEKSANQA
ncbi:LysR family transcriptional regulator [Brevibacillus panacihumi W25]|uniref:LysR family transcriptional regulator n=1 Tax=Brevibacillus panacihumi W25 TaxID=1408254 RepID=V6M0Q7_9BACL|nr:LysR family transcriptional regulator [Brevibacillus panacihumi]EST51510.1 LysR family transcriptional regulator [Brevibacillus panacihumi W25]